MAALEIVGFITGIAGVFLASRGNVLNWPIGIISVSVYIFIFFESKLYGDMILQFFYVLMGFYGWHKWNLVGDKSQINSLRLTTPRWLFFLSINAIAFYVVLFTLKKTDSTVPFLDGLTTVLSLSATWLLAKKCIENWAIWIFVDLIYVGLYCYKMLYLTAILYFVYTILAIYGFVEWKKTIKTQRFD